MGGFIEKTQTGGYWTEIMSDRNLGVSIYTTGIKMSKCCGAIILLKFIEQYPLFLLSLDRWETRKYILIHFTLVLLANFSFWYLMYHMCNWVDYWRRSYAQFQGHVFYEVENVLKLAFQILKFLARPTKYHCCVVCACVLSLASKALVHRIALFDRPDSSNLWNRCTLAEPPFEGFAWSSHETFWCEVLLFFRIKKSSVSKT